MAPPPSPMTDGHWAVAGVDRNALRPLRYSRTSDNLLIIGSETGMVVVPESTIVEKGRLGPGQMIAVNLDEGKRLSRRELKDRIAASIDYGALVKGFRRISRFARSVGRRVAHMEPRRTDRRQIAAGMTLEDVEMILSPMVEDGKEAIGSMGDDTPLAVISDKPRLISQFFRQNFSQVTNPPIDSLRERHVMSLKTRFSNLANILDEKSQNADVLVLESPVLTAAEWHRLKAAFGPVAAEIDCTYDIAAGQEGLRAAISRIREEAVEAVRMGKSELFLTDENIGPDRVAIAMILAAAPSTRISSAMACAAIRRSMSVPPNASTRIISPCSSASAPPRSTPICRSRDRGPPCAGLLGDISLETAVGNYRTAVNEGLLKIMSKMGIAVISSYRGGYNFEAVGLSRALVNDFFPGMPNKISGEGYALALRQRTLTVMPMPSTARLRGCRSAASTSNAMVAKRMPIRRA
jgi:glutamate synthase (NADPH/NADH) large chain